MSSSAPFGFSLRPLARDHWQREIAGLDPETDYERIAFLLSTHEFPWDLQQALSFALFRTYAVPSIGRLLAATAEFTADTQKRHDDTVLVLESIVVNGLESHDGRAAVRRMNQMHGSYQISNEDMRYVLSTFVVTPVRWIERYGWRQQTARETEAVVRYYQRLARLMGITDVPGDYAAFERLLDEYEARHFERDPASRAVADATLALFETFYPRPIRPMMNAFARAIMDDHLLRAFGYDRPPSWLRSLAHRALAARGRLVRLLPPRRKPFNAARSHRVRSYPGGFLIEHLGTFPDAGSDARPEGRVRV